ncbi:hypothetical protein FOA52_015662 [Chlamydomonas sp. UWO 241]|nr:hypothetical protein FOA52_015662 [Chlamydomonas sp. UWO 241]
MASASGPGSSLPGVQDDKFPRFNLNVANPAEKEYLGRWDAMWRDGIQKGQKFDLGQTAPSLQALLTSGQLDVKGRRVLVPGCGRGYDVAAFAAAGASAAVLPDADPSVGPPFPISPELFTSLLPPAGFEIVSMEPVPAERSVGGRAGKEWLGVWRRRASQL